MWSRLLPELAMLALAPLVAVLMLIFFQTPWQVRLFAITAAVVWLTQAIPASYIVWSNVAAGCFLASPDTEYRDGMTLCPGQSTTLRVPIPLEGPGRPVPLRLRMP